jgi:DNA-binding CsgD family transcriptional regulator
MSRWRVAGYGIALALLAWLLAWLDFRTRVRAGSGELYVAGVAVLFTGLGAWAARRLTLGTRRPSPFEENRKAVATLGISERELELLGLLAEGCSNKEIARRASISVNTVKTHLSNLYGKLDVSRRTQAVRRARELRILP